MQFIEINSSRILLTDSPMEEYLRRLELSLIDTDKIHFFIVL